MDPAAKSSLLWGLVGGLSFLVLIQGYHLFGGDFVGFRVMGGVTIAVFAVTAIMSHLIRPFVVRLSRRT